MADLPLRWTVVLWNGERVTVVLLPPTPETRAWVARREDGPERWWVGRGHSPEGALCRALSDCLAPYRAAYPEGEDPVALAVAAEREACADISRSRAAQHRDASASWGGCPMYDEAADEAETIGRAIRARGAQGGERGR